jgi:homotetrameric cytidine deaminase
MLTTAEIQELIIEAELARNKSYAPYSGFRVGASVFVGNEQRRKIYVGSNVENASYGLCICAERSALCHAVLHEGDISDRVLGIAVASQGPEPASPCGACRQFIAEFSTDVPVYLGVDGALVETTSINELLPKAFGGKHLKRK